jgi:nucleoside 2-deoxyribosyltransferase
MRIYLAVTVRGNRETLAAARALAGRLERHGHEILTRHLLDDDVDSQEASLDERAVFDRDLGWLNACDALVAEASGSSFGVGFEVGYVLARAAQTGQRVYLLYDEAYRSRISRMIPGAAHPACTALGYRTAEDLTAFVDEHFAPR